MSGLKVKFLKVEINTKRYFEVLDERIERALRRSAISFLIEVQKNVPVLTGMAKGSLVPLAFDLKSLNRLSFAGSRPTRDKNRFKGIQQGKKPPFFKVDSKKVFEFEIFTEVEHYILNEFFPRGPSNPRGSPRAPWNSFEKGASKMEKIIEKRLREAIVNPFNYLKVRKINRG